MRTVFVYSQLNVKTVIFQTNQFSISTKFKSQNEFYIKQYSLALVHNLNVRKNSISKNSVYHEYSFIYTLLNFQNIKNNSVIHRYTVKTHS